MTAPTEEGTVELQPCPHCGHAHAPEVITSASLRDEDDEYSWPHSDSFAVICSAARPDGRGGCGAMGGFFPTEAEAIAAWNRRASRSPVVGAVGGERWPAPLQHMDDVETPEQAWAFWKPLVSNEDGSLNEDFVKNELADFSMLMRFYSEILCEITGNRISKQTTHPSAVVSVFHDYLTERVEEAVKDEIEAAPASPTAAGPMTEERIDAVVEKLFPPPDIGTGYHKAWLREIAVPIARAIEAAHGIGVSPTGSPEGEVKGSDASGVVGN